MFSFKISCFCMRSLVFVHDRLFLYKISCFCTCSRLFVQDLVFCIRSRVFETSCRYYTAHNYEQPRSSSLLSRSSSTQNLSRRSKTRSIMFFLPLGNFSYSIRFIPDVDGMEYFILWLRPLLSCYVRLVRFRSKPLVNHRAHWVLVLTSFSFPSLLLGFQIIYILFLTL